MRIHLTVVYRASERLMTARVQIRDLVLIVHCTCTKLIDTIQLTRAKRLVIDVFFYF
jgi:hypothetical protein